MSVANKNLRPPVVVVVGHVDHGKTAILDYIRETKVAESESAGITQHIGAYQVEHTSTGSAQEESKKITFIDTPGHEAFSAMRSRGVDVADVAVLVVAADDGVMPQTREAISFIKKTGIPFIVAINKVDKPEADIQQAKNSLLEAEVLLEGYGGEVPSVELSAKTGQGIDELLDMIQLVAELEELKNEPEAPLESVVIESSLDSKKGASATLLVKKGTLRKGAIIAGGTSWAKIRSLEDFQGNIIEEAYPSTPVQVLGFNSVPQVGEKFVEVNSQDEAEERVQKKERKHKEASVVESEEGKKMINLILKADAEGTLEAVHNVLRSVQGEDIALRVLEEEVGPINDSDVRMAVGGNALVIGFRVKPNKVATDVAEQQSVPIITFNTIYDLVEGVRNAITEIVEPEEVEEHIGTVNILEIFKTSSKEMIVGGKVKDGTVKKGLRADVIRDGEKVGTGTIKGLRYGDKEVPERNKGEELGILFTGKTKIEKGDTLEVIEQKVKQPTLSSE